jgi:hypothetical protein
MSGKPPIGHGSPRVYGSHIFDLPFVLINQANTEVWGEVHYGVACARRTIIKFTRGTGLGAGVMIDAKPVELIWPSFEEHVHDLYRGRV